MTARLQLPNRRDSESFGFELGGAKYVATISRFGNGDIAEIFLNGAKVGSDSDANARDAAIVASIALQFGTPAEAIRHALGRDTQGRATGALGCALDQIAEGAR